MSANTYYPSASATTAYPYRIDRGDNGAGDDNGHGTGDDNGHDAGHARSTRSNRGTELMDWCEQTVLPALFERLDRAFPEFHWTRCASGWNGYRPATQGRYVNPATDAVRCSQPWGYVEADGRLVSWLEYLNNGRRPRGREFAEVMQRLAQLAGVEIPASSADLHGAQSFAAENFAAEGSEPIKTTRQREILEAFVAYCKTALSHDHAGPARHFLRQTYGLDADHLADLPIGLYTSGRDVNDFLTGVGFTDAEVADSRVARDARLDHRIVLPWRDRFGRIRTCVAISPAGYPDPQSKRLYWKWKSTEDPLGGDIALRPGSLGLKNLVVTEGLIDVFVFHALGMTNVVSFGRAGKIPTAAQWQALADVGVESVTLALGDNPEGHQRTVAAIKQAAAARRSPTIYALAPGALGTAQCPTTFARLQGVGRFRQHIENRIHGYRFVAETIINAHAVTEAEETSIDWTDDQLLFAIHAAVDFDTEVYRPLRAVELGRFFWPHILGCTGATWEAVRVLLRRKMPPAVDADTLPWQTHDFRRLLTELSRSLKSHETDHFVKQVCSAADAFRSEPIPREVQPKSPPPVKPQVVQPPAPSPAPRQPAPKPATAPPAYARPVYRTKPIPFPLIDMLNRTGESRNVEAVQPAKPMPVQYIAPAPAPQPPEEPALDDPYDLELAAYYLWEKKGRPADSEDTCWFEAKANVQDPEGPKSSADR